jgi:hypothetical protein
MKIGENLASIHAYLCADGYVIKNSENQKKKFYIIGFRNANLTLLKDFQKKFKKYFGKNPKLIEGERCYLNSKEIYQKLNKRFGSFYSREWTMPGLNNKLSCVWLRAFFDCEGWVFCKSHQNRNIGLDSVNERGLNQVIESLKKLGIKTTKRFNAKKNIFRILIYGKENLMKFRKKIDFLHPSKKNKLKKVLEDYMNYYWNFPEEDEKLKRFIKNIIKEKGKKREDRKIVRIISNKEKNLSKLKKGLKELFGIKSKIYKMRNGFGTIYYELNIRTN